ncbi:hypothetical protein LL037_14795 [Clostridium estertheticum]|uniref:hypothetical protein n=1 Tax=Clostridium estertheticum TaxID=238834 RepID=UPI001C0AEC8A|nr:hypothetical protein [Clostridium estertheticum]MBU3202453.1 hypothetical protein [Clostridium estertheticum]WAG63748.1 hypothetical protein LL037_14795 [Clostridium estertheticum]
MVAVVVIAAVASQAISDVKSGEASDITAYMKTGGREALVGALSGAIFGPFGMGEALGAKMIIGGLTNGVESLVRQTLEGKGINFKTLLLDAGIGAATAGVFHGAGKLFQKASPFVKKAFTKIASNISEYTRIAKIALKNMEKGPKSVVLGSNFGNVDEALGRFTKEFKKVKSGGRAELDLINQYPNNNVFSKAVRFNAGEGGTGITYKAFQRNDIDWDMVRITGAKKGRNLTNSQASEKYGLAPILDSDGSVATLHPYKGKLNPFNPMSEETRKAFQKVDSIEYWKTRGRDVGKGVK